MATRARWPPPVDLIGYASYAIELWWHNWHIALSRWHMRKVNANLQEAEAIQGSQQ